MNTTTRGLATGIGEADIAPAVRNGQPCIAIWAGGDGEPALLSVRDSLVLMHALSRTIQEAIGLAADQLADG